MLISIIVPCKNKNVVIDGLLKDISSQKISFSTEVIRVDQVKPPGRARNTGARRAKGDIIVFIDCDIRLGNELLLANLINYLLEEENIGAICASLRTPSTSSGFQTRYAKEIPHSESPIVDKLTDVQVASSACFAIRKEIFFKMGGFNEHIVRGEDSVLSSRLIREGCRVVLAPNTWCYHPSPANLMQLISTNIRNGAGVCFVDTFYPPLNLDVHPKGIVYFSKRKSILQRISRFLSSGLLAIINRKILLLLSKIFYMLGYGYGIFKYRILRLRT